MTDSGNPGKESGFIIPRDVAKDIKTTLPHSEFGAPCCCGFLIGKPGEDLSEISCNQCGDVLAYIVPEDLMAVLNEMELRFGKGKPGSE